MTRLILLGVLLTLVYSWEDLKRFLWMVMRSSRGHKKTFHSLYLDRFVATMLMFATLPVSLTYFLVSDGNLTYKLIILSGQMILVSMTALGLGTFLSRMRLAGYAAGAEKIAVVTYSLLGLFAPATRLMDPWSIERKLIIKFTLFLSLPALAGLALRYASSWHADYELLPQIDLLIQIAVAGLIINLAIGFLEKYFRFYRHGNLSAYLRILLGLIIGSVLILGAQ